MSPYRVPAAALALVAVVLAARAGPASAALRLREQAEDQPERAPQPEEAAPECTADVSGESVMVARCRASCLHKFTAPPPSSSDSGFAECASQPDCMMCWDHCGDRLKGGPESLASVCKDEYLCWAGCRAACDFHFPDGVPGSATGGSWSLRPTNEASTTAIRPMAAPYLDTNGLVVRWKQPHQAATAASATTAANRRPDTTTRRPDTTTAAPSSTTSAPFDLEGTSSDAAASVESAESDEGVRAQGDSAEDQYDDDAKAEDAPATTAKPAPHRRVVYIVSARMAASSAWKELKQTTDLWLQLSGSTRAAMRAVSVMAVSADGPVARGSACVQPTSHGSQQQDQDGEDYYDEDASDEDEDRDDEGGSDNNAIPDASLQRLAQRSFAQLRGTVQHGVLLRALLRDRAQAKQQTDEEEDDADDEDDDEEVLLDQRRLDLVHRLLGAGRGRGRGKGRGEKAKAGWGLHLVGVWAAGGGARLPRARVAWTAPRGVAQTEALVSWAVPALRISGSRVVSGVSQAEVPLVEQHATRVTVGDAHSSDVSAALVLQLSVQTDASAAAVDDAAPLVREESAAPAVQAAPAVVDAAPRTPTYEQAALWEATLVAVGLVVGAAALCVALLLAAYGVHGRVARCCRGRGHGMHAGIHAKSASVEPLNSPDQNNV